MRNASQSKLMLPVVMTPGGRPARVLAEGEQHQRSRVTMPSATVAISQELEPRAHERAHRHAFHHDAPQRAGPQAPGTTASASGKPSVTQKGETQHRAEHHGCCPEQNSRSRDTAWVT